VQPVVFVALALLVQAQVSGIHCGVRRPTLRRCDFYRLSCLRLRDRLACRVSSLVHGAFCFADKCYGAPRHAGLSGRYVCGKWYARRAVPLLACRMCAKARLYLVEFKKAYARID